MVHVYIDPFQISSSDKADIILITHPHYDHCSIEDVRKVVNADTVIIAPSECKAKIDNGKFHYKEFKSISPGVSFAIYGCSIRAIPAYNVGKHFHERHFNWVGYVLSIGGKTVYHAGDTDFIHEMAGLKVGIALLPVGGTYTMTAREAAQAVALVKPKIAIPMHYGSIIGSKDDAEIFLRTVAHSKVQILEKNQPIEIKYIKGN